METRKKMKIIIEMTFGIFFISSTVIDWNGIGLLSEVLKEYKKPP